MKIPHQKILKAISDLKKPAVDLLKNKTQLLKILQSSLLKFDHLKKKYQDQVNDVKKLQSLVLAWVKGEYKKIPWKSLTAACAAILYFLNPFDLIPDFLGPIGLVDDAMVLAWAVKLIKKDLDDFLNWKAEQNSSKSKKDITLKPHQDYKEIN